MKIDKTDLTKIFDAAKANFINLDKCDLDSQQFATKCYMIAAGQVLGLDIEVVERIFVEPVEE